MINFAVDFTNMCTQTIFSVLDHLTAWASAKSKAYAVRKAKGLPMKGIYHDSAASVPTIKHHRKL